MNRCDNLLHRRVTSVGQKIPKNVVDETLCYFGIPRLSTIDIGCANTVTFKMGGYGHLCFTVASTGGIKLTEKRFSTFQLPPFAVIEMWNACPVGRYLPAMHVLGTKRKAVTTTMMTGNFVNDIWKRRTGGYFNNGKSIFILDSARSHLGEEVDVNGTEKIIHDRMMSLLQFLDTHVKKPFKDQLKDKWENWIEKGEAKYADNGNFKRALYEIFAEWVNEVWKKVSTHGLLLKGFWQCGYRIVITQGKVLSFTFGYLKPQRERGKVLDEAAQEVSHI